MPRLVLVLFIIVGILGLQAMAEKYEVNQSVGEDEPTGVATTRISDQPASSPSKSSSDEYTAAEAPEIRRMGKHHSSEKSVAGGGVIIGGLVTAIFATVFCYIRVTRRNNGATK